MYNIHIFFGEFLVDAFLPLPPSSAGVLATLNASKTRVWRVGWSAALLVKPPGGMVAVTFETRTIYL